MAPVLTGKLPVRGLKVGVILSGGNVDLEPMFQALHDAYPGIITISKGYRQPTCFNTAENIQKRASR